LEKDRIDFFLASRVMGEREAPVGGVAAIVTCDVHVPRHGIVRVKREHEPAEIEKAIPDGPGAAFQPTTSS